MIKSTYITEFKEKELKQATDEFRKATDKSTMENLSVIIEQIKKTFSKLFSEIAQIQGENHIGRITVSLLRISAWEERQRAKIEVYDKDEIVGKLLYETETDVSCIFAEWENYRKRIAALAEEKGVRRYIKDPVICFFMEERLTDMALYLYALYKYVLIDADEIENYELMNTIPGFMITIGEYMDWQRVLYAQVPTVNLEQINKGELVMFARFKNKTYRDLHIEGANLESTKFSDCRFYNCTFTDVNLNDALFENCQFKNVVMKSGTMYGAVMKKCVRVHSDFSGMKTKWQPFCGTDEEYDIYADAVGLDTQEQKLQKSLREETE